MNNKKDDLPTKVLRRLGVWCFMPAALLLGSAKVVTAAPLDYEIGNAAVRQCKLVYSDGRPDEPLPTCEGTKDFGNVTTPFTVKMVLTNEINQDVESAAVQISAGGCSSINPADIKVGFDVNRLIGCTLTVSADRYRRSKSYTGYTGTPQEALQRVCDASIFATSAPVNCTPWSAPWNGNQNLYCVGYDANTIELGIQYYSIKIPSGYTQSSFDSSVVPRFNQNLSVYPFAINSMANDFCGGETGYIENYTNVKRLIY